MTYVVLARKYRPKTFEEVVGQEAIATTLRNAIESDHVAHAYLFAGPRGVGKTSMARILAAALNCECGPTTDPCGTCQSCKNIFAGEDVDVIEIDGASHTGVDNIRDLRSNATYTPAHSLFKIYIIDEVHMLSKPAFNALLKTLEEPPGHVKFIFATTEPHKVIETVQSRCQRFDFRNISTGDIIKRLEQITKSEGIEADEKALRMVARRARGGMRDSQSLLDQLIAYDASKVTVESVETVLGRRLDEETFEMLDIIAKRDPGAALGLVERLSTRGESVVEFMGQFQEQLRNLMVLLAGNADELLRDLPTEQVSRLGEFKEKFNLQSVLYMVSLVGEALRRMRTSTQRRMLTELTLVKLSTMEDMSTLDEILKHIESLESNPVQAQSTQTATPARAPAHAPAQPAKKVEAPPRAPSPSPAAGASNPLGKGWQQILDQLKEVGKRRLAAFMMEGAVESWNDGELVIGFAKAFDFHRKQLDELETRKDLEKLITEVLRKPVRLKLVEVESAGPRSETDSHSADVEEIEPVRREGSTGETSSGSLVRKAVDLYRGQVIDTE